MNVARRGLVYLMKNERRQGVVEGEADLGAWLFRRTALSGILPAWSIGTDVEEPRFSKGPYEVLPQPSGYYGLFQDVVSAYYEIYDAPPPPEGRSYRLTSRLIGADGDTVFTAHDSLHVTEGTAWPHALAIDVATLAAGHYLLSLELRSADTADPPPTTVADVDILWSAESWGAYAEDDYDVESKVLLSNEDALAFSALPLGAKEARLQELWRSVDPTPETAENEAYLEFLRRVQHANVHYTVFDRGMFSDRGRVYIRYGEPDEIRIERLPVNDRTLGVALNQEIPSESSRRVSNQDSGIVDTRPFEIWTYNFRGNEIVPRRGISETGNNLKFVFVDDQGYGDYMLRYSSTAGMH
jgi:GWxTD domain-containing protein